MVGRGGSAVSVATFELPAIFLRFSSNPDTGDRSISSDMLRLIGMVILGVLFELDPSAAFLLAAINSFGVESEANGAFRIN